MNTFQTALLMQTFNFIGATSIAVALAILLDVPAQACDFTEKCPIDGASSRLVKTEYSGLVEIGVYEHSLTSGGTHVFRQRCN